MSIVNQGGRLRKLEAGAVVVIRASHKLRWGIVERTFGARRCYVKLGTRPEWSADIEYNSQLKVVGSADIARRYVEETNAAYELYAAAKAAANEKCESVFKSIK